MNTLVTAPENQSRPNGKPRRRWVKVDVDEESFQNLHLMAAHSLMRIQPYLCFIRWPSAAINSLVK